MKFMSIACAAVGIALAPLALSSTPAQADNIVFRIASGHPTTMVYPNLMKEYFQAELVKRVAERTDHTVSFVEGYSGSIVKVAETLEGVRDGIVDIGGFCFCFEPSNLPLHAFQVMLPFGTMDPEVSLKIAQDVFAEVPYMSEIFEKEFNQKLIGLIADGGYNLGTTFEWSTVADLKDVRLGGAGLNLNWLRFVGATPVQGALPETYTNLQTGVMDGYIMFPSAWLNMKLYEPGPYYTLIGFGAITWHGLTINQQKWDSLPADVQEIVLEVAKDYEEQTGTVNKELYDKQVEELRGLISVNELDASVRKEWAESLKEWPQQMADELNGKGLPATQVLNLALDAAERHGHEWPVRYEVK